MRAFAFLHSVFMHKLFLLFQLLLRQTGVHLLLGLTGVHGRISQLRVLI